MSGHADETRGQPSVLRHAYTSGGRGASLRRLVVAVRDFGRMPIGRKRRAVRCLWTLAITSAQIHTTRPDRLVDLLGTPDVATVDPVAATAPTSDQARRAAEIGRVIARSADVLPWHPSCLRQAIAAGRELERAGIDHLIHLGVTDATTLEAHAWVTVDGIVVVGDRGRAAFTPVASFHRPGRRRSP